MPSAWTLIDSSFPAFTGKEKVKEQIPVILNYMYMLSEGLKYQLSNLNNSNWNSSALDNLKLETTADLVEQMTAATEQINAILNRLNSLSAQILLVETDVSYIEKQQEESKQAVSALEEWAAGAEAVLQELEDRMLRAEEALAVLEEVVQLVGEGGTAIGGDGKNVYLLGNVYVNGHLLT